MPIADFRDQLIAASLKRRFLGAIGEQMGDFRDQLIAASLKRRISRRGLP